VLTRCSKHTGDASAIDITECLCGDADDKGKAVKCEIGQMAGVYSFGYCFNDLKVHLTTKAHFLAVVGDGADYKAFMQYLKGARPQASQKGCKVVEKSSASLCR